MYKIAITGKANTGKNTVGKLLNKEIYSKEFQRTGKFTHNYRPKLLAFADPIKEMIQIAYPEIPRKWLYGPSKNRSQEIPGAFYQGKPLTVRQLLINLGNDFGRANKPDIWLCNFDRRLEKTLSNSFTKIVIVPDCRFRNEFDHLKNLGFYQIRLLRKDHTKIDDVSETNQDGIADSEFNYVIHNDGTLKDLAAEVKKIVSQL